MQTWHRAFTDSTQIIVGIIVSSIVIIIVIIVAPIPRIIFRMKDKILEAFNHVLWNTCLIVHHCYKICFILIPFLSQFNMSIVLVIHIIFWKIMI